MKNIFALTLLLASQSFAGGHDPKVIASLLKDSKLSLLQGIAQAEETSGVATSAKFETTDDGKLALSVYTIPEGLGVEPEKATLTEVAGDPTSTPYVPHAKVFIDKAHIARASVHMTLFQQSKYSLKQVIERALKKAPGTPVDVRNPIVRNQRPVADVIIVDYDEVYVVTVDLLSGKAKVTSR